MGRDAGISRRRFGALSTAALTGALGAGCAGGSGGRPAGVGFVLSHEQFRTPELVSFAERAEQAGFGPVWASDHLQPWQDDQGHSMFPWITLALAARSTRRVVIGSGVTCPTYRHHPVDVAQAFASLELLAPGRTFLGVGTGEALNEQAGTGSYGPYQERHDRLVEAIALIRQLWTGQRISFQGRFYRTDQLRLYDVPQHPPPIHVAAGGPRSARLAGRYGDGWITESGASLDPGLRGAFETGAREAGRDPATMPRFAEIFAVVGDQAAVERGARLWRFLGAPTDQPNPVAIQQAAQRAPLSAVTAGWLTGTDPAVHVAGLRRYLDAGVTPFVHFAQDDPPAAIDFYGSRVLPALAR
ncbi:F420-dependent hydroxymycolic acid dehydrogenase [Saccharopolyspora rosea]|uniref:F420-dependent hydroxymycolic acid dehydrogenase n=1 Tax=Saccharopolyspora rosea TaxID=524884 RepID=UPI0021DB6623|nr:F420-dependent hydroxymycolic acid dehydrogenase [Saccharopolyspora rosea]